MRMDGARQAELVDAYYLPMMRDNATDADDELLRAVALAGRTTSAAEVIELLEGQWRPRVMGGWYALLHDGDDVRAAVATSIETAAGALTAPPLAVAAVTLLGSGAREHLERYAAEDAAHEWGACGLVAAAIVHLGSIPTTCRPTDTDRERFADLLAVGRRLPAIA